MAVRWLRTMGPGSGPGTRGKFSYSLRAAEGGGVRNCPGESSSGEE